jgi:hypothetical protein
VFGEIAASAVSLKSRLRYFQFLSDVPNLKSKKMNPASFKKHPYQPRGFALIVTLSLMILLTVIAIGLLTLSSISLRTSSQGEAMQTARANARMALVLAIGDLQKQLGPDTRISARADMLDPDNGPLLGAWKSWEGTDHDGSGRPISPGNYKSEKDKRFLRWLVSGNPTTLATVGGLPDIKAATDRVTLIGENTLGTAADQAKLQVHLEPVLVESRKRKGAYAWWVGGENQKARLPKPSTVANTNADWAAAAQSHSIADPKPFGMESLLTDPEPASKAISLKQSDLISQTGSQPASRQHFFDLSTVSTGLLTNTATGGWRKDLSLFTENYDKLPATGLPMFRLTPDSDGSSGRASQSQIRPAGSLLYPWASYRGSASNRPMEQQGAAASWANLKDYALMYRKFNGSGSFSLPSASLAAAGNTYNYLHTVRAMPVIARVQWVFSYYGRTTGSQYTPGILVTPVVTLWNPYNTTLTGIGPLHLTLGDQNNPSPLPIVVKYQIGTVAMPDFRSLTTGSANYSMPPMAISSIKVLKYQINSVADLKPGATRVYSSSGGWQLPSATLALDPGYKTDGGHLFLCKTADSSNDNIYTKGTDKVILSAKYNNASPQKGKQAVGVRLLARQDASDAGSNANEMEYRMSLATSAADPVEHRLADSPILSTISNTAYPFLSMTFGTKVGGNLSSPDQVTVPSKGFAQTHPLTSYSATGDMDLAEPTIARDYAGTAHRVNSSLDFNFIKHTALDGLTPNVNVADGHSGYIMTGITPPTGLARSIVAELPVSPLASLGELQNWDMRFGNPVPPFSFNIIGNSDASPLLPSDGVDNGGNAATNLQHDDSYCANHLLFDDWFFSSIAGGRTGQFGGNASLLKSCFTEFVKGEAPLTNRAYHPLVEDSSLAEQSASGADTLYDEKVNQPDSWRTIASRLEVEGMFNVNSTSVAAWRALLGHARGQQVPYYKANGSISLGPETDHPVSRFTVAGDAEAGTAGRASQFSGYRKLDEKLLDDLAGKIVEQVRKRGPFLSLSEFINRQLSGDKDLALAGAIQSALNELEKNSDLYSGIIDAYDAQNKYAAPISGADYKFAEAATGSGIYGLPGWTRQADVIRPLAPILSARDDTFTIRTYGDARDANGKITARATCEAVVRRTRDYVDPADNADLADPPISAVNQTFGRRYQIVSFRWLTPNEI